MIALVFAVSLLLAGPSLVGALDGTGSVDTALWHLLLSLLLTSVAARFVRSLVQGYERSSAARAAAASAEEAAGRRRGDA